MFPSVNQPMVRFLAVLTAASMAGLQGYTIVSGQMPLSGKPSGDLLQRRATKTDGQEPLQRLPAALLTGRECHEGRLYAE